MEVAPGIHRIESDLGERFVCQYVLAGDERTLLVDTGMPETPETVIAPYFESIGRSLEQLDLVLISHADLDHAGGKAAIRRSSPRALLACHELDRRWIESGEAMVSENYLWHEPFGFEEPDAEGRAELERGCGEDAPVDLALRGGETVRLSPGWRAELRHLPGHTLGHLAVWDARSRAAIIVDAVLERGIYDRAGNLLIPPRIYDLDAYRTTISTLQELEPELLLTAHYPVMDAEAAQAFLARSLRFTEELEAAVRDERDRGVSELWPLTVAVDRRLGPYPEFMIELGASVRAAEALVAS
jgi:glyoxylase-like metal-dependent hydrolase (beta-lactamase superfamily II)